MIIFAAKGAKVREEKNRNWKLEIFPVKIKIPVDKTPDIHYIYSMKTAVYIPDDIYDTAEKVAKKMKLTRSRLYSMAIREYIESYFPENITEKLNSIYDKDGEDMKLDKRLYAAQLDILEKEEW